MQYRDHVMTTLRPMSRPAFCAIKRTTGPVWSEWPALFALNVEAHVRGTRSLLGRLLACWWETITAKEV